MHQVASRGEELCPHLAAVRGEVGLEDADVSAESVARAEQRPRQGGRHQLRGPPLLQGHAVLEEDAVHPQQVLALHHEAVAVVRGQACEVTGDDVNI